MLCVSALVVALIGWSAVARVDEVAVGVGEIVPTGRVLVVQHLEGGIISGILVHDGDHVAKGQVLVKLDPAAALAELDQTRARIAALELQADRLQAFVDGKESEKRWATNIAGRYTSLAGEQRAILALQEAARISQRNVIETQIRQKEAELAGLRRQRASLERQVEIQTTLSQAQETVASVDQALQRFGATAETFDLTANLCGEGIVITSCAHAVAQAKFCRC